jgi:hypothetical protein
VLQALLSADLKPADTISDDTVRPPVAESLVAQAGRPPASGSPIS